jgi:hypothetical protein
MELVIGWGSDIKAKCFDVVGPFLLVESFKWSKSLLLYYGCDGSILTAEWISYKY